MPTKKTQTAEKQDYIVTNSEIGDNTKIWHFSNVYGSTIGQDCKVGSYTEIGNATIGDNVTIGAHCFICEGVTIGDNAWIGPRVTFTNDKYPPSGKDKWQKTVIEDGARIGASVTILCGNTVARDALIGAGSVVTCNIPEGEIWAGVPARKVGILSA